MVNLFLIPKDVSFFHSLIVVCWNPRPHDILDIKKQVAFSPASEVRAPPSQLSGKYWYSSNRCTSFSDTSTDTHACTSNYSSTSYWLSKTIDKCRCVLVKPLRYQTQNVLVGKRQNINFNLNSKPLSSSVPPRWLSHVEKASRRKFTLGPGFKLS